MRVARFGVSVVAQFKNFAVLVVALFSLLAAGTACGGASAAGSAPRAVVVLTADQAPQIILPTGAFETVVATSSTTTMPLERNASEKLEDAGSTDRETDVVRSDMEDDSDLASVDATTSTIEASSMTTSTTTTTITTTTTQPPTKETVPLAEEDLNPGVKLMGALDDFNRCLDSEGHEWIGFPNGDLGPEDPVNQPGYLQALQLCNSRTQIASVYQEYEASRNELSPEEIEQENRDFIDLTACLRRLGWDVGELRPDENGLLNPGEQFSGPDGEIVADDIRDCVSEIALRREEGSS